MANSHLSRDASRSFAGFTKRCVLLVLLTICIGNILVVSSEAVCRDKRKTIKIKGKVHKFCQWCAGDPENRCTKIKVKTKKKGMKKPRKGKNKKKRVIYNPKKLCKCTCADYIGENQAPSEEPVEPPEEPVEPPEDPLPPPEDPSGDPDLDPPNFIAGKKPCPTDMPGDFGSFFGSNTSRSSVHDGSRSFQRSCMRDGYEKGRVCSYDWAWRGCRYGELFCMPDLVCTCASDAATPGRDLWSCREHSFETCEKPERPGPDGITPPDLVPEEAGTVCLEGDAPPEPPPGFDTGVEDDETLQIRRRLRG